MLWQVIDFSPPHVIWTKNMRRVDSVSEYQISHSVCSVASTTDTFHNFVYISQLLCVRIIQIAFPHWKYVICRSQHNIGVAVKQFALHRNHF